MARQCDLQDSYVNYFNKLCLVLARAHSYSFPMLRWLMILLFVGVFSAGCEKGASPDLTLEAAPESTAKRPNIIVIYTDDQGYGDVGIHGVLDDIKTPNIDALARGGALMTNGYVTAPQCSPSRLGLLTGQYQNKIGFRINGDFKNPVIAENFRNSQTIAETLLEAGYQTGMAGKWHLGPDAEIMDHGFQTIFKTQGRKGYWNMDLNGNEFEPKRQEGGYHIDTGAKFASTFIEKNADQPFFFYWAPRAPHSPMDAAPKYLKRFPGEMPDRRRHALAMMSAVDDGVGSIVKTLREQGLEENTLIFVISDNGAPYKITKADKAKSRHGWNGSLNDPLNGEKGMLTEGGIRVPFIVYWKDNIIPGTIFDKPVISLDVAATATEIAGVKPNAELPGRNLMPFLTGEKDTAPHEALYWQSVTQAAIRKDDWKLLKFGDKTYLFDLSKDAPETDNLADQHPDLVKELDEKLSKWVAGLPMPIAEDDPRKIQQDIIHGFYYSYYLDGQEEAVLKQFEAKLRELEAKTYGD